MLRSLFSSLRPLRAPTFWVAWIQGIACGVPLALTGSTLSFWLSTEQISLAVVGFFAFVALPYTFKCLWAPLIDLIKFPLARSLPHSAPGVFRAHPHLIGALAAQAGLAICLILMGFLMPFVSTTPEGAYLVFLAILAFLASFFASTQDITLNAIRLSLVTHRMLGQSTAAYVFGYRLGMLVSGAGAIALSFFFSWGEIYYGMALLVLLLAGLTCLLLSKISSPLENGKKPHNWKRAFVVPFREFMSRPYALWTVLFILLYFLGDCLLAQVSPAYLLKLGYTKLEIASAVKFFGWIMTIAGGFLGGWLVDRLHILSSLALCSFLHMIANGGFLVLGALGHHVPTLYSVFALIDLTGGMSMVAFITYFGKLSHPTHRATQYALCTSLMAVPRAVFASVSGVLVVHLGWPLFYSFCMLLAVPGILLALFLRKRRLV